MGAARRRLFAASLAALALAAPAAAHATVNFTPPNSFPAGAQGVDLVVRDFDGNGAPDVATANSGAGTSSVLLGDGQAHFVPPSEYPVGGAPLSIAAGNFNSDASIDLALADQQGHVRVLPGQGGAFGAAQTVNTSGSASRVAAGDVNGDGFIDLVSADNTAAPGDVSIELGDGAGNFGAPIVQNVRGAPAELELADLNGDGRADVITADGGMGSVSIAPGKADGSIGPVSSFDVGSNTAGLVLADFDGDGFLDIAVGHMSRTVSVLLGRGGGDFAPREDFQTLSPNQRALAAADFDRDGRLDLAASTNGGNLEVLRGTGSGAFATATDEGGALEGLAAPDLDGDAAPDVVGLQGNDVVVLGNISTKGAPPLPQPTVAETANVAPVSGTVLVKQPGTNRFIRLTRGDQIPIGSLVDTTKGSVRLTSAAGGGRVQSGVFRGGLFKLGQTRGPRPITDLRLAAKLRCVSGRRPVHAGAKRPRSRRLFGNAHGRFRTRGRHSIAAVRGTKWLVKDTCRKTTTVSLRGTVVVRDLVKHRTVTLHSGQRYVARRGNR